MAAPASSPTLVGRYAMFDRIAAGGMAAVHLGRLLSEGGFARTVAIKRLHPQFALDPEFATMFLDEARLAARIRHPNVVPTLDVVTAEGELFLVMEYVEGESLAALLRAAADRSVAVPVDVSVGILVQALHGLHAAHEATNDHGEPLGLVHRDVSPHNILVGAHGVARVLDFGVAKALGQSHRTREGQLKGKLGYLSPEQVLGHPVTRASDVFAAAVVLWEALTGRRLFAGDSEGAVLRRVMDAEVSAPSTLAPGVSPRLDAVVLQALAKQPFDRFESALAMAEALERAAPAAAPAAIGRFVRELAGDRLAERTRLLEAIEGSAPATIEPPPCSVRDVARAGVPEARVDAPASRAMAAPASRAMAAAATARDARAGATRDPEARTETHDRRAALARRKRIALAAAASFVLVALAVQKAAGPTVPPRVAAAPAALSTRSAIPVAAVAASAPDVPPQIPSAAPATAAPLSTPAMDATLPTRPTGSASRSSGRAGVARAGTGEGRTAGGASSHPRVVPRAVDLYTRE